MRPNNYSLTKTEVNHFLSLSPSKDLSQYFGDTSPNNLTSFIKQNFVDELKHQDLKTTTHHYQTMQELLVSYRDALSGIVTEKIESECFPTGIGYVRNAVNQIPLGKRRDPNDPIFFAINYLLRAISTVRAIDHVLQFYAETDDASFYFEQRNQLKQYLVNTISCVTYKLQHEYSFLSRQGNHDALRKIEVSFNSDLIKVLHNSQLDLGIEPHSKPLNIISFILLPLTIIYRLFVAWWRPVKKPYQQLIDAYRFMSSLLDPAPSTVTILKADDVTHVETATPICTKTKKQIEDLKITESIVPNGKGNYHAKKPLALQLVNRAFSELMQKQNRAYSAQMRHLIAPGVKNGFIETIDMYFDPGPEGKQSELHFEPVVRCGSLAYVGKGENQERTLQHTQENLAQLHDYLNPENNLHLLCLPTDSFLHQQDKVYQNSLQATENSKVDQLTYAPVNYHGCFHVPCLAPMMQSQELTKLAHRHSKTDRALYAAAVFKQAWLTPNIVALVFCCSGQDRTGTLLMLINLFEFLNFYNETHKQKITFSDAAIIYIGALHPAFMATVLAEGAFGLKNCSAPGKLIQAEVKKFLYVKTANCNKKTPIASHAVNHLPQINPLNSTPKQLILRELTGYLQLRNHWFGGFFFLLFSSAVLRAKINLVVTFMQHISHANGNKINYADELQQFKQDHLQLIEDENKSRLFTRVGTGNLGKRIDFIEATLTQQQPLADDCASTTSSTP